MLERNRSILLPFVLRRWQPIDSSLTREAQFAVWLESLKPPHCQQHRQTVMVLNREASQRELFDTDAAYKFFMQDDAPSRETRACSYPFGAVFRCPACRVAYALCPPEFHTTSFETFDTSTPERAKALARCREFASQVNKCGRGFALLVGLTGTGKTRLACNIVRELDSADALYVRQGQLTVALRATYSRKDVFLHQQRGNDDEAGDDEPPSPLEIVQGVRFLVVDEIGCVPLANDERLLLDESLKHRYDEGKPTVLISNLALDQLKEFLGDALTDRIRHATANGKFILQFKGESFRRTTGESYLEGLK